MKTSLNIILTFCLITFLSFTQLEAQNSKIEQVFGNSHFLFEQIDDVIVISMEKSPWEAFTISLTNENIISNPICSIQLKSYDDINIIIDFSDGNTVFEGISLDINGSNEYHNLQFDLSEIVSSLEFESNPYLIIYVNGGQKYTGEIMLKNINFTEKNENDETLESNEQIDTKELLVYPNPSADIINIELPRNFNGQIIVREIAGKIVYTSNINDSFGSIAQANLSQLRAGTYFVSLIDETNILSSKIQIY